MIWLPYVAYAAGAFVALQVTFLVYGCAAAMIGRGKIPWFWWLPIGLCFVVGLVLDVAFQMTIACVLFLELPREKTFSARIKRHVRETLGWRETEALWWQKMLNDAVPNHI